VASQTIEILDIGPVLFERSKRAKHLNISVRPYTGVRVAVPRGISFKRAKSAICSHIGWIQKQLDKMKHLEKKYEAASKNAVKINQPEARKRLVCRLDKLSKRHGFSYNKVFIRNQKTRWGSCSAKNNISLNLKLVKLPEDLVDYVIMHELVHTRIKNHTKAFWMELDRIVGNAKVQDSRLKEYIIALQD
jgi:predicted metal-dependent hydrolase